MLVCLCIQKTPGTKYYVNISDMCNTDYPFTKCLHPKRIYNRYIDQYLTVPCGCCKACNINRQSRMSMLCKFEEADHRFCMFVTLTYSNKYVPLALPILNLHTKSYDFYCKTERLQKYYRDSALADSPLSVLGEFHHHKSVLKMFQNKWRVDGCMPFLSKPDLQNFLKRFRKYINKHTIYNEQLRYYAVGEYGPRTFRPHYHLLFFFDKEETLQVFQEALRKSWRFGRVDASLSRRECSSYVAGYVNSTCTLPEIYSSRAFKPFALHSKFFALGFFKSKRKEIYENEPSKFIQQSRELFGHVVDFMPWRSLTSYFFPRCPQYALRNDNQRWYSYNIIQRAWIFYGKLSPCALTNSILQHLEKNEITEYFEVNKTSVTSDNYDTLFNRVYNELNISYHFITFCSDSMDVRDRRKAFSRIINFYRCRDYEQLTNWYELQEKYISGSGPDGFEHFYDNISHINPPSMIVPFKYKALQDIRVYDGFYKDVQERFDKSIKHKVLNDLNNIFVEV